jgi:hypothetical protein
MSSSRLNSFWESIRYVSQMVHLLQSDLSLPWVWLPLHNWMNYWCFPIGVFGQMSDDWFCLDIDEHKAAEAFTSSASRQHTLQEFWRSSCFLFFCLIGNKKCAHLVPGSPWFSTWRMLCTLFTFHVKNPLQYKHTHLIGSSVFNRIQ